MDASPSIWREKQRLRAAVFVAITAPLMRAAAETCLQEHGFAVYGDVTDADDVIEGVLRERPEVALIDVDLPGGGIAAARGLTAAVPDMPVVMLAEGPTEADVLEAVRAGAVGCLPMNISLDGLARALSGVLHGEAALPRALVGAVLTEIAISDAMLAYGGAWEGASDLTLRELQVLRLAARGASTADIAQELSISPVTARRHSAEICRKLGVPDRATAVELVKRSHMPLGSHTAPLGTV
jgi:DNA-binding NarL/FixJ family response regulator